ncbi:TOM1-like protein 2, partial [Notechis scutatus]|uniref:TOM1-like protein 2 n=1 Tax=Notechis scutatus TaxID=8663 RepID=A0A6J1W247_9SAUR
MVGSTAPAANLSSQLAGLDLGTNNVSGALSSLPHSNPRDDFDVFAQTRGGSVADQRKTTKEDPQTAKGVAPAPDIRKPKSGGRRGKGGSGPLEPIDRWLISQGMVSTPSPLHVALTPP